MRMKALQILSLSTLLMVADLTASAQSPSASPQDMKTVTATREMLAAFVNAYTPPANNGKVT